MEEDKSYFQKNKLEILLGLAFIATLFAPYILTRTSCIKSLDFSTTGQIGDTIGGITGPIINLIGAILVYVAFKEQRVANEQSDNANNFENIVRQIDKLTSTIFENDSFNLEHLSNSIETKVMNIEANNLEDIPENAEYFNNQDGYENTFFTHKYELSNVETAKIFLVVFMMNNIVSDFNNVKPFTDKHKSLFKQFVTVVQLIFPLGLSKISALLKENNKRYYSNTKDEENTIIKLIDDLLVDMKALARRYIATN